MNLMDELYWMFRDIAPFFLFLIFILFIILPMKKASSSKLWENFGHNLKIFYLYSAAFVGLIITIVGGMALTTKFFESEVFGVEYNYIDYWECTYDGKGYYEEINEDVATGDEDAETTEECEARVEERAHEDYLNDAKRTYASGLSGLIFGLFLWIPHMMWARKEK